MKDIEILPNEAGAPTVILHGDAKAAADAKGISTIHISLSHSEVRGFPSPFPDSLIDYSS